MSSIFRLGLRLRGDSVLTATSLREILGWHTGVIVTDAAAVRFTNVLSDLRYFLFAFSAQPTTPPRFCFCEGAVRAPPNR